MVTSHGRPGRERTGFPPRPRNRIYKNQIFDL
jgi:hypothetical protein